jgi:hypothetical protein
MISRVLLALVAMVFFAFPAAPPATAGCGGCGGSVLHEAVPPLYEIARGPHAHHLNVVHMPRFSPAALTEPDTSPAHCEAHVALQPMYDVLQQRWQWLPISTQNYVRQVFDTHGVPLALVLGSSAAEQHGPTLWFFALAIGLFIFGGMPMWLRTLRSFGQRLRTAA